MRHAHANYLIAADIGGGRKVNIRFISQAGSDASAAAAALGATTPQGTQKLVVPGQTTDVAADTPAEKPITDTRGREITPAELRKMQREGRKQAMRLQQGRL